MNEIVSFGGRPVVGFGDPVGLGAVERRNPLPLGRYWVDVFDPKREAFRAWLSRNRGAVRAVTTESFAEVGDYPARDWYLFEVTAPVSWEGPGFPTIAGPGVQHAEDTSQRPPPPPDPLDQIKVDVPSTIKSAIPWIVGSVVLVGGALFVYYHPRPRAA